MINTRRIVILTREIMRLTENNRNVRSQCSRNVHLPVTGAYPTKMLRTATPMITTPTTNTKMVSGRRA